MDTDREWEQFGQIDPYYGVLSDDQFRKGRMTADAKQAFFDSGEEHVASVLETIRARVDPQFVVGRGLDYGCGVGRLVIPLARRAVHVTGVDVSDAMLAEARRNVAERGLENVEFVKADDALSKVRGTFDFIHCYIVFQHIPARRGNAVLDGLLSRLDAGGCGALHFPFDRLDHPLKKGLYRLVKSSSTASRLFNLARGRSLREPIMQMNLYDLNHVLGRLADGGCSSIHLQRTNDGGSLGYMIYFKKQA